MRGLIACLKQFGDRIRLLKGQDFSLKCPQQKSAQIIVPEVSGLQHHE
jgi:hypothetical protein